MKIINNKKAGVFAVIGIIILVIIALIVIAGIYLYFFHIFKTIRVCVSNAEITITNLSCSDNEYCIELLQNNILNISQNKLPEFAQKKADEILSYAITCDNTCQFKKIYGDLFEWEQNKSAKFKGCKTGDKEFIVKIRGKEGIQILRYMSKN